MAGFHVINRFTNDATYKAVRGVLKLPQDCDCRAESIQGATDGVFPEFFFGFYSSSGVYGLDIGVMYRKFGRATHFCPFCYSSNAIANGSWKEGLSPFRVGDTIAMSAYFSGNNIILAMQKSDGTQAINLTVPLTAAAVSDFSSGSRIHRELTIASNVKNFLNTTAYFSDTTWLETTMTRTNGTEVKMTGTNTELKHNPDTDNPPNLDFSTRYGYVNLGVVNGFLQEKGSLDFR